MTLDPALAVMTRSTFKVDSVKRYLSTPTSVADASAPKTELATVELSPIPGETTNGDLTLYGIPATFADQFAVGTNFHMYLFKA